MCKHNCILGVFPDINSIHIYNDMHSLYGRAITRTGHKVSEIMVLTPESLAGFFGGYAAFEPGSRWLASAAQDPASRNALYEIGEYLKNRRGNGNLFVEISVEPSKEGLCQNHVVSVTNKHATTVRQVLPSCAVAALALGAL
jgi:hypothetical protein